MPTKVEYNKEKGTIFSVLADGKFRTEVPEGTEGAVKREYETSDGTKGSKIELVAGSISGMILDIGIYEGDFGKQLQLGLGENGTVDTTVFLSCQSPFGEDFMKKLPNIDVTREVKLAPFSFKDDTNGKFRKGITIYQKEEGKEAVKIADYYHSKVEDKIIAQNGYPEVPAEAKNWDSEDWKLYFGGARKFLLEQVKKHALYGKKVEVTNTPRVGASTTSTGIEYPKEEISPDDIPW